MSMVEEDVELRDLLAQTLEKNGCLAKLRAELRASIFLALDEDIKLSAQQPLQNLRIQSYLQTPEGRIMFCLVREFLEFFNLQFTISVYDPESFLDSTGQYEGRQKVAKDLGLDNTEEPTVPLLQQLLKIAQSKSNILDINLNLNESVKGSFKDDSLNVDSSYNKTESCSNSKCSDDNLGLTLEKSNQAEHLQNGNLNATFEIKSPTVICNSTRRVIDEHVRDSIDQLSSIEIEEERRTYDYSQSVADKSADISDPVNNVPKPDDVNKTLLLGAQMGNINLTYDLDTSAVNGSEINQDINISNTSIALPKYLKDIREDDTYEDTSSIPEDSEALEKYNGINISEEFENDVPFKNPSSSNSESAVQISSKVSNLKSDLERLNLSPQRPKASLSSLSDLPPLPVAKTRVSSEILPSLYSKDFKNKSNLKELDKMLDIDYEEDFSNELDLGSSPVNSNQSRKFNVEETFFGNKTDLDMLNHINKKDPKKSPKVISDVGTAVLKPVQTNCSSIVKTRVNDHDNDSSINEYTHESVNFAQ